jgi:hypothetical protein
MLLVSLLFCFGLLEYFEEKVTRWRPKLRRQRTSSAIFCLQKATSQMHENVLMYHTCMIQNSMYDHQRSPEGDVEPLIHPVGATYGHRQIIH